MKVRWLDPLHILVILNLFNIFTSSSRWLILFALRFVCSVIFVKHLFIHLPPAKCYLNLSPYLRKVGLTELQKTLLSDTFFRFRLLKYFSLVLRNKFRQIFLCFLWLFQSSAEPFHQIYFLVLILSCENSASS